MKTKFTALLLAALILSSQMIACSQPTDNADVSESESESKTAAESLADITSDEIIEADRVADDLPERNFNDFSFNIYTRESATNYAYLTEEIVGEVFNDAIYERNERIAERFGISFSETTYSDQNLPVTNVQSGDNTFSLMNVRCTAANTMGQKSLVRDMSALEYINLDKPYWDKELAEMINIGNRTFTAIGASNMTAIDFLVVMIFNKSLVEEYQIENLYDAVREDRWTLDLFGQYAALATEDKNGDGTYDSSDQYGALGSSIFLQCSMIPASNAWYIKKDADNLPYFDMSADGYFTNVFEKIFQILYDNNSWYKNPETANAQPENTAIFRNGQGLFMGSQVYFIDSMRDMESDFGILPFPKYDEAQQEYYTRLCFYDTAVIPVTVPDIDCSSIILEALSCDSFNTVVPAYKEKILKSKYARDEDSSQMIDIIMQNRVVDMGDTVYVDNIRNGFITQAFVNNSRDISSRIKAISGMMERQLQKLIEDYSDSQE